MLRRSLTGHIRRGSCSSGPLQAAVLPVARLHAVPAQHQYSCSVTGRQKRSFSSTIASSKPPSAGQVFASINAIPGIWESTVNLRDLIGDFRELQAVARLSGANGNLVAARAYKFAERSLFPLLHAQQSKHNVKLDDIKTLLPESEGQSWRIIREKATTGEVAQLAKLDEEMKAMALFNRINGIGPKHAKKLFEKGIRTFEDLEVEAKKEVKESMLSHAQQMGVKYFDDIERLIPRDEIDKFAELLHAALQKADPNKFSGQILGSYRRGEKWCSDIDFVIRHEDYQEEDPDISRALIQKVVSAVKDTGILHEKALADGDKKYHTIARLPKHKTSRRIDVRIAANEAYHYMTLGCTGDLELMKYLRNTAIDKNMHLNEYGMGPRMTGEMRGMQKGADLWDPKRKILVDSEEEIFERLGLPYIPPEKRSYNHWRHLLPPRRM